MFFRKIIVCIIYSYSQKKIMEGNMKKFWIIIFSVVTFLLLFLSNGIFKEFRTNSDEMKVGLILNGEIDDGSWSESHYKALEELQDESSIELIYRENVPCNERSELVMKELINEGCKLIICNSYDFGEYELKIAKEYPNINFLHATGTQYSDNLSSYFGRMYQIRYLTGIVAGMQTETNEIGYVAAYNIPEVIRGIDAFTLGVRSINPKAKVYVSWCDSWIDDDKAAKATNKLLEKTNIDIVTQHCNSNITLEIADKAGIWSIGYNLDNSEKYPNSYLTGAIWNWKDFYLSQVQLCKSGNFKGKIYWEGYESGRVDLAPFNPKIKKQVREVVETNMEMLKNGSFDVFNGPIYDNKGIKQVNEGENLSDNVLLNELDWFVKGVEILNAKE